MDQRLPKDPLVLVALVDRVDLWTLGNPDFLVFQYLLLDQTVRVGLMVQRDLVLLNLLSGLTDLLVRQVRKVRLGH